MSLFEKRKQVFTTILANKLVSYIDPKLIEQQLYNNFYPKFYYRIKEFNKYQYYPPVPNIVRKSINFNAKKKINVSNGELNDRQFYSIYSKPADYIEGFDDFRIIDVCVLHDNFTLAKEFYQGQFELSSERKSIYQKWIKEKLLPYLIDSGQVLAIKGRGDVYDNNRVCGPCSNIDLMIFVDFRSLSTVSYDKFKNYLRKFKAKCYINIIKYNISKGEFFGISENINKQYKNTLNLTLDIFCLFDFLNNINISNDLDPYYRNAFTYKSILFDPKNILLDIVREL